MNKTAMGALGAGALAVAAAVAVSVGTPAGTCVDVIASEQGDGGKGHAQVVAYRVCSWDGGSSEIDEARWVSAPYPRPGGQKDPVTPLASVNQLNAPCGCRRTSDAVGNCKWWPPRADAGQTAPMGMTLPAGKFSAQCAQTLCVETEAREHVAGCNKAGHGAGCGMAAECR